MKAPNIEVKNADYDGALYTRALTVTLDGREIISATFDDKYVGSDQESLETDKEELTAVFLEAAKDNGLIRKIEKEE